MVKEIALIIAIALSLGWLSARAYVHHRAHRLEAALEAQNVTAATSTVTENIADEVTEKYQDESQKRNTDFDSSEVQNLGLAPDFLMNELKAVSGLNPLADFPGVKIVAEPDSEKGFDKAPLSKQIVMLAAANKMILSIKDCLKSAAECGVSDIGNDYITVGGHPLHILLERALMIETLGQANHTPGYDVISNSDLASVMSVPQHNVAVLAVALLTSRQLNSDDLQQVWDHGGDVKGQAKAQYFKMLGDYLQGDDIATEKSSARAGYIRELDRTLADRSDAWTAVTVISAMENFKLTEPEFKKEAHRVCDIPIFATGEDSRARLLDNLDSQARRLKVCLKTSSGSTCDKKLAVRLTPENYCQ